MVVVIYEWGGCIEEVHVCSSMEIAESFISEQNTSDGAEYRTYEPIIHGLCG
jgi:hypothetical protein